MTRATESLQDWAALGAEAQMLYYSAEDRGSAEADKAATEFAEAGRLWARAAVETPPEVENYELTRESLRARAHNAFRRALDRAPEREDIIKDAIAVCEAELRDLEIVYGERAVGRLNYQKYEGWRRVLQDLLEGHGEEEPESEEEDPDERVSSASDALLPVPFPLDPPADVPSTRGLEIGLWTSVGLTGASAAVALGTGLARLRTPFRGAAYQAIYDAAVASHNDSIAGNEVSTVAESDMCTQARASGVDGGLINATVAARCDRHGALGSVALASTITAGVFAISSLVLTGVLVHRKKRRYMGNNTRFRGALIPSYGGVSGTFTLRF